MRVTFKLESGTQTWVRISSKLGSGLLRIRVNVRVPPCDYSLDICLVSVLALCPSRVRVYFGMAFGQIPYCLSIDFAMNRSL